LLGKRKRCLLYHELRGECVVWYYGDGDEVTVEAVFKPNGEVRVLRGRVVKEVGKVEKERS
jgi:hypothetical protein